MEESKPRAVVADMLSLVRIINTSQDRGSCEAGGNDLDQRGQERLQMKIRLLENLPETTSKRLLFISEQNASDGLQFLELLALLGHDRTQHGWIFTHEFTGSAICGKIELQDGVLVALSLFRYPHDAQMIQYMQSKMQLVK
jgi:hypothetical protein